MSTQPTLSTNPLNEQHLAEINKALADVEQGLRHAELAQSAGLDVSAQIAQLKANQSKLLLIKQTYFPGQ